MSSACRPWIFQRSYSSLAVQRCTKKAVSPSSATALSSQVGGDLFQQRLGQAQEISRVGVQASRSEDLTDRLYGPFAVGGVPGRGVGLAQLEDEGVGVDGLPVDRCAEEQALGLGQHLRAGEELVEEDVVGGQSQGLGQGALEGGMGGESGLDVAASGLLLEGCSQTPGDVGEAARSSRQQGVEVLEGAGMSAHHAPDPLDVMLVEAVKSWQGPHQLEGVGEREGADVAEGQGFIACIGQHEGVAGRDEQAAGLEGW